MNDLLGDEQIRTAQVYAARDEHTIDALPRLVAGLRPASSSNDIHALRSVTALLIGTCVYLTQKKADVLFKEAFIGQVFMQLNVGDLTIGRSNAVDEVQACTEYIEGIIREGVEAINHADAHLNDPQHKHTLNDVVGPLVMIVTLLLIWRYNATNGETGQPREVSDLTIASFLDES